MTVAETKRPPGRPPKPAGEKYQEMRIRMHPDERAEFEALVPPSMRAAFIRDAIRARLRQHDALD